MAMTADVLPHFVGPLRIELAPDGCRATLLEPLLFYSLRYRGLFVIPAGFVTDFNSIPRVCHTLIPKQGEGAKAGVLHDAAYQGRLRTAQGIRQHCTRAVADTLFLEALEACGVSWPVRHLMYRAVRLAGGRAYRPYVPPPSRG